VIVLNSPRKLCFFFLLSCAFFFSVVKIRFVVVRKTQKNNKIIEVFLSLSSISGLLTTYFLTTHIVCFIFNKVSMLRTVTSRIARRAAAAASSSSASSSRCFAAAAQGKGDLVKDFFADSQRKFRAYAEKSKTNPLPLDGDDAKIKAYVEKNKQIMAEVIFRCLFSLLASSSSFERRHFIVISAFFFSISPHARAHEKTFTDSFTLSLSLSLSRTHDIYQIGIPSATERIDDTIDAAFEEATSVRQYLEYTNEVRQSMGLEDPTGVYKTLFQTLDDVEKKIGKPLTSSDPQFAQFEDAIEKGMGELLGKSLDELADAADLADAKEEASRLKAEMEATKARAG
jgi:hypothetical protein